MFTAETDRGLGLPVVHKPYPPGDEGIMESIRTICRKVREGMTTAVMKEYVGNVFRQAGVLKSSIRDRALATFNHVDSKTGYAPDALGSEQIQSAAITLCVPGAQLCIPIADCDDLVTALGTLLSAGGMDVEIVRQFFGAGQQQHVLLEVKIEDGSWMPLDLTPHYPSMVRVPVGTKAPASRELRYSPFDSKLTGLPEQAQFVGMGGLPVLWWRGGKYVQLSKDTTKFTGLGGILPNLSDLQPQMKWLGTIWSTFDPKGRSWDTALSDAYNRAEQKNWVRGDSTSYFDLTAIIIRSALLSRAASAMPAPGPDFAKALDNTWVMVSTKAGYQPGVTSIDDLKAAAKRNNQVAALALFELILLIVVVAVMAVVYCYAIYRASIIVDEILTKLVAFAEEVWHNVQIQKIIQRHIDNPDAPWDPEEKDYLHQLEKQQEESHKEVIAPPTLAPASQPPSFWDSPWAIFGTIAILGGTTLAVVYRKEIVSAVKVGHRYARMRHGKSAAMVSTHA